MRRTVAVFALAALSWSQGVALSCDMGAPVPMLEAHQSAPTPTAPHHLPNEETTATPHGEHHGDGGECLMILAACAAASARPAQTTNLVRLPAVSVQGNLYIAPIPVAVAMGVETPPPRHHA